MAQQVIALRNAQMHESAVAGARESAPSHVCVGRVCTMVRDCEWVVAWRAARAVELLGVAA